MLTTSLLFLGFVILLTAEFFLPTSGLLGIVSAILLVVANLNAFSISMPFGFVTLITSIIVTPLMLMMLIQIWPHTPVGRRVLNLKPGEQPDQATQHLTQDGTPLDELVGKQGVAKTELLPSGLVVIEGGKYDAISLGDRIERGATIVVVSISAGKIKVRLVDQSSTNELDSNNGTSVQSPAALEIPLDSLDFD